MVWNPFKPREVGTVSPIDSGNNNIQTQGTGNTDLINFSSNSVSASESSASDGMKKSMDDAKNALKGMGFKSDEINLLTTKLSPEVLMAAMSKDNGESIIKARLKELKTEDSSEAASSKSYANAKNNERGIQEQYREMTEKLTGLGYSEKEAADIIKNHSEKVDSLIKDCKDKKISEEQLDKELNDEMSSLCDKAMKEVPDIDEKAIDAQSDKYSSLDASTKNADGEETPVLAEGSEEQAADMGAAGALAQGGAGDSQVVLWNGEGNDEKELQQIKSGIQAQAQSAQGDSLGGSAVDASKSAAIDATEKLDSTQKAQETAEVTNVEKTEKVKSTEDTKKATETQIQQLQSNIQQLTQAVKAMSQAVKAMNLAGKAMVVTGKAMMAAGKAMIAAGSTTPPNPGLIEKGEKLLEKGEKLIEKGEKVIDKAEKLQQKLEKVEKTITEVQTALSAAEGNLDALEATLVTAMDEFAKSNEDLAKLKTAYQDAKNVADVVNAAKDRDIMTFVAAASQACESIDRRIDEIKQSKQGKELNTAPAKAVTYQGTASALNTSSETPTLNSDGGNSMDEATDNPATVDRTSSPDSKKKTKNDTPPAADGSGSKDSTPIANTQPKAPETKQTKTGNEKPSTSSVIKSTLKGVSASAKAIGEFAGAAGKVFGALGNKDLAMGLNNFAKIADGASELTGAGANMVGIGKQENVLIRKAEKYLKEHKIPVTDENIQTAIKLAEEKKIELK